MESSTLYNLSIERGVISAVLYDGKLYEDVISIIKPKDFYLPFHQKVFEAMERLYINDLPIDEIFVKEELEKREAYDAEYYLELISTAPVETVESYAKEIKDKAVKRELLHFANLVKQSVVENEDDRAIDTVEKIQSELFEIATQSMTGDFKDGEKIALSTLEYIKEQQKKANKLVTGLDTGFIDLNKMTSGFHPGDLIILAARPSMGKTSFALNIAGHALKNDKAVAVFSLEMPAEQLMLRMLSASAGLPLQQVRTGNLDEQGWSTLTRAVDYYSSTQLYVDDDGNATIHSVRAKLRKLKVMNDNLSLVVIDYLQLMSGDNKERHLQVSEISRGLKLLARELNVPIIALSQLNRGLESRPDKRPMLSDLRESGAIEQDADIILFVYRDDVYKNREARQKIKEAEQKGERSEIQIVEKEVESAEIIIGKQRNGPTGTVDLQFNKKFTRFENKEIEINEYTPMEDTQISYSNDAPAVDIPIL